MVGARVGGVDILILRLLISLVAEVAHALLVLLFDYALLSPDATLHNATLNVGLRGVVIAITAAVIVQIPLLHFHS